MRRLTAGSDPAQAARGKLPGNAIRDARNVGGNTRVASNTGDLAQGLAQPARYRPSIDPTAGAPTVGRRSRHSTGSVHPLGICCTNLIRAADVQRGADAQSVAASPAPKPMPLG